MGKPLQQSETSLYERDFFAWTQEQATKMRERRQDQVDWDNLAEEIESVGRREKREIGDRLETLLRLLLKWQFQPDLRCHSWQSGIGEQRTFLDGILEMSPSLASYPEEVLQEEYTWARERAAIETGLPIRTFSEAVPYTLAEILDYRFMPGRPWSPDELLGN